MDRFSNAYCGLPPAPEQIWGRWNLDPNLGLVLLVGLGAYLALSRRSSHTRRLLFVTGWSVLAFALISPLCALSVSLFSARVGQHIVLTLIAAPLLGYGLAGRSNTRPFLAAAGFFISLWMWHMPAPYTATFESDVTYWLMHATLVGSAVLLWQACFSATRAFSAAPALLFTAVQMSLIGALLTFAPHPLFAPHLLTPAIWGLTPLVDQQLGGVLMWAPGGLLFLAATLGAVHLGLAEQARHSQSAPA